MSPQDSDGSKQMPLWQHLDELRSSLIRSLIAILIGIVLTYSFSTPLIHFLERPLLNVLPNESAHLYFTGITDKFFIYVQISLLAAIILVYPYLMFEAWKFVSPGLKQKEKRFAIPFILFGTCAFIVGVAFAYYLVLPYGYRFLIEFGSPSDKPIITLKDYFSLTLKMLVGIGLIFETPVVLLLLAKFDIVRKETLIKNRKIAFALSAVVAAVITPSPDAFTMILVWIPFYLLYELSIVGVRWLCPNRTP